MHSARLHYIAFLSALLALQAVPMRGAPETSMPAPFPTGTLLQLAREFFTMAEGLPGEDIRAVAVTREGILFAATDKGLVHLEPRRWLHIPGPPGSGQPTRQELQSAQRWVRDWARSSLARPMPS